jgi:hypothetical protein
MKIDVVSLLAVLQIRPFFDAMTGALDAERHLLHVVGIGPHVDVLFPLETQVDSVGRRSSSLFHSCSLCLKRSCHIFIVGEVLCSQPRYRRFETAL